MPLKVQSSFGILFRFIEIGKSLDFLHYQKQQQKDTDNNRFGASSAHGQANMVRFNYFADRGVFTRDPSSGRYRVNMAEMGDAVTQLSSLILILQGDGDYAGVTALFEELGMIRPQLQADLDKLAVNQIPVDITFDQGINSLSL